MGFLDDAIGLVTERLNSAFHHILPEPTPTPSPPSFTPADTFGGGFGLGGSISDLFGGGAGQGFSVADLFQGGPTAYGQALRQPGMGDLFESAYKTAQSKVQQATAKGTALGQGVDARLEPYRELLNQTAARTGLPAWYYGGAILAESGGKADIVNPTSGAVGLLQALPGGGRGANYPIERLKDPAFNLAIAEREFQDAGQKATAEGYQPGTVDHAVRTIALAQRYENYNDPNSAPNQRVRSYLEPLSRTAAQSVAAAVPGTPGTKAQTVLAKADEWVQAAPRYNMVGGATTRQEADCSGLIVGVMKELGMPFAPNVRTAEQLRQASTPVPRDQAQPGDLIFFQGTYDTPGASHVGIVTSDGVMLDTNDARGKPGYVNYQNSAYWQKHFLEIRRPPQYAQ